MVVSSVNSSSAGFLRRRLMEIGIRDGYYDALKRV
jgi:Fe2+ transport system protein FeoA